MINLEPWSAQRRTLLTGFAALSANTIIGCNRVMAATVEQNTLKRQAVGLRAFNSERASPGFTLFAPHFVQNRVVYLIDLKGEVVHTWNMPYPPGLSGYLTERGTLFYNGRTPEESFLSRFPRTVFDGCGPTSMTHSATMALHGELWVNKRVRGELR